MHEEPMRSKRLDLVREPEQLFRPPSSSNRPLILAAVAMVVLLLLAISNEWPTFLRTGAERSKLASVAPPALSSGTPGRSDPLSGESPTKDSLRQEQVTKCLSSAGAAAYVDGGCPPGTRSSSITVRPDSNLADGMSAAEREASVRENRALAQAQAEGERPTAMAAYPSPTAAECASLDAAVRALDAQARQPLAAQMQDWVRAQRKSARDRQFALRCS
jgi:hypothetical protein